MKYFPNRETSKKKRLRVFIKGLLLNLYYTLYFILDSPFLEEHFFHRSVKLPHFAVIKIKQFVVNVLNIKSAETNLAQKNKEFMKQKYRSKRGLGS